MDLNTHIMGGSYISGPTHFQPNVISVPHAQFDMNFARKALPTIFTGPGWTTNTIIQTAPVGYSTPNPIHFSVTALPASIVGGGVPSARPNNSVKKDCNK